MNNRTIPTFLLLLCSFALLPWFSAAAQNGTADGMINSPQGTEYFVSFPQNGDEQRKPSPRFLGLWITSEVPTTGIIEIPTGKAEWTVRSFATKPGELTIIELPATLEQIISEEISRGGVHIQSRDPIAVYAYHSRFLSGAAYPAVPLSLWGRRYLPLSLPAADGSYNSARTSQIQIVAAFDGTLVTIRPSARLYTKAAGEEVQVALKKGETYLFQAFKDQTVEGNGDLSGTEITSNFPVGVVTGHVRSPITVSGSFNAVQDYSSHQAAMILPDSLWGQEYYSAPMNGVGRFRAIASAYNTQLTITWCKPDGSVDRQENVTLNRGELFDTRGTAINGASYWSATRPILVMQHQVGATYSDPFNNAPAMIPLTASDQFRNRALLTVPTELRGEQFHKPLLTVLAKGSNSNPFGDVQLDGTSISQLPGVVIRRIGQTPCWYATLSVASGAHLLTASNGVAIAGTVRAGTTGGDGLTYTLPSWVPQVGPDTEAPFVKEQAAATKGVMQLQVSDRTQGYFSGVSDVRLLNSPGWQRQQYSAPLTMDDDATAAFKAVQDPSGPLSIQLCDNVGNCNVIEFPAVCFKTANVDRNSVAISTTQGKPATETLNVASNICGDEAHLEILGFVGGDAGAYLSASLGGGGAAATIPANSAIPLELTVVGNPPQGDYATTLRLKTDDSTLVVPITLHVAGPSGVAFQQGAEQQRAVLAPNPFRTSTFLLVDQPLGSNATMIVSDQLGRPVRSFQPAQLAGKTRVEWDGTSNDGTPAASGMYLLTISDPTTSNGQTRTVQSVLLLR
ncbi:MAG: hypothetical protein JNJ94_04525 [Chlorobi bacterium]|nr:hypothetical protein [Chlorobiota bacterium]